MKKLNIRILLLLFSVALPFIAYGQYQLPNPGFENWESNGEPTRVSLVQYSYRLFGRLGLNHRPIIPAK